jgi:hypothetical protein
VLDPGNPARERDERLTGTWGRDRTGTRELAGSFALRKPEIPVKPFHRSRKTDFKLRSLGWIYNPQNVIK